MLFKTFPRLPFGVQEPFAGSSYNIDRALTSDLLGFQKIQESCIDAVSNRDYFLESDLFLE